jgi:uncharacterized protein with ParB-like and HNH nuclease domain
MAKRKNNEVDLEEKRKRDLQNERNESLWIPDPTYYFSEGDSAEIGNLENVLVCDVFENGKVYEIDYSKTDNNYGIPVTSHHNRMFVKWYEIRPLSGESHNLIENDDLRLHYQQRDTMGILGNLYDFRTDMNPSYQRGYVWDMSDQIALIDSVFKNIDIGKFVFIKLPYSDDGYWYEILDGKQRVHALANFYENRFSYNGLFYNDLGRIEKSHFKNYPISYAQLENLTEQQKLRYFLTLNRTGKVMSSDHLAKIKKMLENK